MDTLLSAIVTVVFGTWCVGMVLTWPVWYFGGKFSKAKSHYGINWREFAWIFLGRFIIWPYFFIRWLQRRGTGEKLRAVVYLDGQEVRKYLSTSLYEIDDKCVAYTRSEVRTESLTESSACPFCDEDLSNLKRKDITGHFLSNHFDDEVRGDPTSSLQLPCGCPHARWPSNDFRPDEIVPHLKREHGFNQRAPYQPQQTDQMANAQEGRWHPDPTGRHQFRWWDGNQWTQHVSGQGQISVDASAIGQAS